MLTKYILRWIVTGAYADEVEAESIQAAREYFKSQYHGILAGLYVSED